MFNKKFLSPGKVRKEIFRTLRDYEHYFSRDHRFKQLQLSIKVPENMGGIIFIGEVPNVEEYFTDLDEELLSEVSGANALLYSGFLHKHPNPRGFINLMIQSGIYPHQIHDFIGYLDHNKIVENSL